MIPKRMETYLRERLREGTWNNRLVRDGDLCFMEFDSTDVDRLARLGIEVDNLGPRLVVCLWDDAAPIEIGGYLVVDNLAMGQPSMGGIRMLPEVTPSAIHNLARGIPDVQLGTRRQDRIEPLFVAPKNPAGQVWHRRTCNRRPAV